MFGCGAAPAKRGERKSLLSAPRRQKRHGRLLTFEQGSWRFAPRLIRANDSLDQRVPDDVVGVEEGECNTIHVAKDIDRLTEAGLLAGWQISLRDIAGDHGLGAESDTGKEHLHLL